MKLKLKGMIKMQHDPLGKNITIISKSINYYFNKRLEKYNIKRNQLQILHYLNNKQGVSQNELGAALMVDKITITKLLKGLVEGGFVEKRKGKEDQRRKELYVTRKGDQLHTEVCDIMREVTDILFQGFSEGEKQIVGELLIRMTENIYDVVQNSRSK